MMRIIMARMVVVIMMRLLLMAMVTVALSKMVMVMEQVLDTLSISQQLHQLHQVRVNTPVSHQNSCFFPTAVNLMAFSHG